MNREAISIPGDWALVDLVNDDDEDIGEPDAGEAKKEAALGDEEKKGNEENNGPPERAVMPPSPPPSA